MVRQKYIKLSIRYTDGRERYIDKVRIEQSLEGRSFRYLGRTFILREDETDMASLFLCERCGVSLPPDEIFECRFCESLPSKLEKIALELQGADSKDGDGYLVLRCPEYKRIIVVKKGGYLLREIKHHRILAAFYFDGCRWKENKNIAEYRGIRKEWRKRCQILS